jgi:hypothetical protein
MADEPTTLRNIGEGIGEGIGEVTATVLDANLEPVLSFLGYIILALMGVGLVITIFEWLKKLGQSDNNYRGLSEHRDKKE